MPNDSRNSPLRPVTVPVRALTMFDAKDTTGLGAAGSTYGLGRGYTVFSVMAFRAATGTSGGSTKPSYRIQGSIDGSNWHLIGAATRAITVRSSAATLGTVTSTAAISWVRARINNFSTSGGANPDKVKTTVKILPVS